jgi:SAM-dependent methyltransferase
VSASRRADPLTGALPSTQFLPEGTEQERLAPFDRIVFDRLWRGREKTTRRESELLDALLERCDGRRVLEVGTGDGRLSPVISGRALEYVGTDVVPAFLARLPGKLPGRPEVPRISSNAYHLPFVSGAFATIVLIRVFNFLSSPTLALRELARVLAPGGSLVVSYHPRPSIETFSDDLRRGLHRRWGDSYRPLTFAREPPPPDPKGHVARWPPSRAELRACFASDWESEVEQAVGLEDYRVFRWLPDPTLRGLSRLLGGPDLLPMRMARFRRPGNGEAALPPLGSILACPRCGRPPAGGEWGFDTSGRCVGCGFEFRRVDGVIDGRYVPAELPEGVAPAR